MQKHDGEGSSPDTFLGWRFLREHFFRELCGWSLCLGARLGRGLGRDTVIVLAMRVVGTLLWMGYLVVLARSLSKPDFALTIYVTNFALVAVLVITMGRDVSLLRLSARLWGSADAAQIGGVLHQARRDVLLAGMLLGVALAGGVWIGLDWPVTRSLPLALLCGAMATLLAQMGLSRDVLRACGRMWQSQLGLNITRAAVPLVGGLLALRSGGMRAETALAMFLAALCLSVLIEAWMLAPLGLNSAAAPEARTHPADAGLALGRSAWQIWPGDVANAIQMRLAGLIAGAVLSPDAAALFLAAERLANLAQFPISATSQASAPRLARAAVAPAPALQAGLSKASMLMGLGTCIGVGGALAMSWPALRAMGPEFTAAFPLVLILVAGHLSWSVFGLAQPALHLSGFFRSYSFLAVAACLFTALLVCGGGQKAGALGTAVGFALGWWLTNLAYTLTFWRLSGCRSGVLSWSPSMIRAAMRRSLLWGRG